MAKTSTHVCSSYVFHACFYAWNWRSHDWILIGINTNKSGTKFYIYVKMRCIMYVWIIYYTLLIGKLLLYYSPPHSMTMSKIQTVVADLRLRESEN